MKTTRQMQRIPKGGVYVWCDRRLDYPRKLAKHIRREDIEIVGPSWLEEKRYIGRRLSGLEIDHALPFDKCENYVYAMLRVEKITKKNKTS